MEGLWQGLANAASWVGIKVGDAAKKIKELGKDAIDAAGRALTWILSQIPRGEEVFEMLKEFTSDVAEKIGDYIKDALKEFADYFLENKEKIIGSIFKAGSDSGVKEKIEQLISDAKNAASENAQEIKDWIASVISNPADAAIKLFSSRGVLGNAAQIVTKLILRHSKSASKAVQGLAFQFFGTKPGKLVMRLITLMSLDMGGDEILQAAGRVWKAAKGLSSTKLDLDHVGRDLEDTLPDIVQGLISGEGAIEQIIRSAVGDATAAVNLLKNAIKLSFNALKKVAAAKLPNALAAIKIEPESKTGKVVGAGILALIGAAEGKIGEARLERRSLILEHRSIVRKARAARENGPMTRITERRKRFTPHQVAI